MMAALKRLRELGVPITQSAVSSAEALMTDKCGSCGGYEAYRSCAYCEQLFGRRLAAAQIAEWESHGRYRHADMAVLRGML